jgi:hypothetical protein
MWCIKCVILVLRIANMLVIGERTENRIPCLASRA